MDQGHVDALPKFPKVNSVASRRPHFDAKDWQKLTRHLQEFVKIENRAIRRDGMLNLGFNPDSGHRGRVEIARTGKQERWKAVCQGLNPPY